jgi:hypothetical protein
MNLQADLASLRHVATSLRATIGDMTDAAGTGRPEGPDDPIDLFYAELRRLKGDASWRALEVATRIPRATLSDWFTNRRVVDWEKYEPLLQHFGVESGSFDEQSLKILWRHAHTAYQDQLNQHRRTGPLPPRSITSGQPPLIVHPGDARVSPPPASAFFNRGTAPGNSPTADAEHGGDGGNPSRADTMSAEQSPVSGLIEPLDLPVPGNQAGRAGPRRTWLRLQVGRLGWLLPGRRVTMGTWVAVMACVLTAMVGIAYVAVFENIGSTAGDSPTPRISRRGVGWIPPSPTTLPNGGPAISCPPATNRPDSTAEAEDHIAYAQYYRQHNIFLLYDDAPDGRSALLELEIPGVLAHADWFNSGGWTCYGPRHSLAMIVSPNLLQPHHPVRYRVCVGAGKKRNQRPPEECGPWITDQPARPAPRQSRP